MKSFFIPLLFGLIFFSACNSGEENPSLQTESNELGFQEKIRPAAQGGTSAAYFIYKNELNIADTLRSVSSDVSGTTQIHESYEAEGGMMGMKERHDIIVEAQNSITFKQGGLHVMLIGLTRDLAEGDSVSIELDFAQAGKVSKELVVLP